ncbi:hypothetical protein QQF64_019625 [Cirrhinus molitorella]|uniref:Uncharacterized protein n=1 Tax=Cirrhinus molitorella TaxID=172907 RepID=A0ABR3LJC2_9TELE
MSKDAEKYKERAKSLMDVSVDMQDYTLSDVTDPGFGNTLMLFAHHLPRLTTKPVSEKGKMKHWKYVVAIYHSISSLIDERL